MAASEFESRQFIIDKSSVELHEVIGKGGFTDEVRSASLTLPSGEIRKAAAKKVINVQVKEIQVMKKMKHKNVITFYGVLKKEMDTYIIMELAENGNLRHYLDECRKNKMRLPTEMTRKWVYEAACGLNHLHQIDYTHRDIKSLNYLITKDFTVKLGDLGLATVLDITRGTTSMRGTCRWMAPEVIKEQKRSVKSDVFSYGTVVWEICTTDIPYEEERGDFQVMNAVCNGKRPSIPDDCPQQLKELIQMCWLEDYNLRPDMNKICLQLEECIQEEEQSASELSNKFQQTLTPIDDESMETMTKDQSEETDQQHASKTGMPVIKQLHEREGLSSAEYISCDSGLGTLSSGPACAGAMYKMCDKPRGFCLIINNVDFSKAREHGNELDDREGSDVDREMLHGMFTKFKFNVICKTNLSSEEMNECFDEIRCQDHTSANAFVCCILTHGKYRQLAGCDGKDITIQNIISNFTEEKCPSLAKKPKMFFIQASQGAESLEEHHLSTHSDTTLPTTDFLIYFATVPWNVSNLDTELSCTGVLVNKLNMLHEEEDLFCILQKVESELSNKSILGQACETICHLHKKMYFTLWESTPKSASIVKNMEPGLPVYQIKNKERSCLPQVLEKVTIVIKKYHQSYM